MPEFRGAAIGQIREVETRVRVGPGKELPAPPWPRVLGDSRLRGSCPSHYTSLVWVREPTMESYAKWVLAATHSSGPAGTKIGT